MKKYLFPLLLSALTFASCSDLMQDSFEGEKLDASFQTIDESNVVTMADVVALGTVPTDSTRTSADEVTFDCVRGTDNDTLLYVCNKRGGGWILYSSDRRTPPVVAQSDHGSFEELMQIDAAKAWVQGMAEDIRVIKTLADDQLNFTSAEIEANKNFWKSVSDPDGFVKEVLGITSARGQGIDLPGGHWELHSTENGSEVYDSIPRLTHTNWSQGSPYNMYCPFRTDYPSLHAPAGCVAIAAAQMLYFLNDSLGVPATAPSEATCTGDITNYTMWQGNYTSTIWATMNTNGADAAPLIANVGYLVGMNYGNEGSGATTSNLVNMVFAPYGISCSYTEYSSHIDSLQMSLLNGFPVIMRASASLSNGQTAGHAFIVDGYKRSRTYVKYTYVWVYDSFNPGTLQPWLDRVEYVYGSPVIGWIGMNWGWGSSYNLDDEWFTLTGAWMKNGYNWNLSRHMIHNFQIINGQ